MCTSQWWTIIKRYVDAESFNFLIIRIHQNNIKQFGHQKHRQESIRKSKCDVALHEVPKIYQINIELIVN